MYEQNEHSQLHHAHHIAEYQQCNSCKVMYQELIIVLE